MSTSFINVFENTGIAYRIRHYDAQHFTINDQCYTHSLLIYSDQPPEEYTDYWPSEDWLNTHTERFRSYDVVLIGAGENIDMDSRRRWTLQFSRYHLAIDIMNTSAACRTFNIVSEEGRKVCALLILASTQI